MYNYNELNKEKKVEDNGLNDLCLIEIDYNDQDDINENDNEDSRKEDEDSRED